MQASGGTAYLENGAMGEAEAKRAFESAFLGVSAFTFGPFVGYELAVGRMLRLPSPAASTLWNLKRSSCI
jgi:hypothetical protein